MVQQYEHIRYRCPIPVQIRALVYFHHNVDDLLLSDKRKEKEMKLDEVVIEINRLFEHAES